MRHIRQSLSLKLSISVLLMTTVIFLTSLGILFVASRRNIRQESVEHAASVLNNVEQGVRRYLNMVETATNSNTWLVTQNYIPDSLIDYSRRIVLLNGNVDGCSITAAPDVFPQYGGYFSAYTVRESDTIVTVREAVYDYFEKPWYKTPVKLGKACWIDPFDDSNAGSLSASDLIASYCKPLFNAEGKLLGVISSDLSLPKLAAAISQERPYPNAYFLMLGEHGHYFVHPDSARLISHTIFSENDARKHPDIITLGHEMTNGHEGTMRIEVDGRPCLVSYRPVEGTAWSLALVCPESDIFQSYHQLTNIIVLLILMGLVFIFFFSRRIIAHAIRPLQLLLQQSQSIAEGNYDERISHTDRKDAVGRLQNSFATMQESLHRHVTDIRQINEGRIQRNEELHAARQLVEEADRQKTLFIQNVTHQIRTPLNIILGFAQIMCDNNHELTPDETKEFSGMMAHNAMALNRMVLMLYDSSDSGITEEIDNLRLEPVSCNEVAREGIEATHRHFPELSITFYTTVPDDFTIITDRLYLMRSLRELLYNSAKYSDGQHISVQVSTTDTHVHFVYADTGAGISAEYYDKMFNLFTKVDDLSEGLGLGLPLAKRHITNLGGRLTLDTDYHEGCRFIVELPLQSGE
ncbi:MAG: HAMP domain-containing protein [Prevotella sp.]|nr:HAMP domain-containing protein [Prevotella sp.]